MLTKQERLKLTESINASVSESFQRNFKQKEFLKTALCEAMEPQILNEGIGRSVYQFLKRAVGVTVGGNVGGFFGSFAGLGIGAALIVISAGFIGGTTGVPMTTALSSIDPAILGSVIVGSYAVGGLYGAWKGMVKGWNMAAPSNEHELLIGEILKVTDERDILAEKLEEEIVRNSINSGFVEEKITKSVSKYERQINSLTKKQMSLGKQYLRKFASDGKNSDYLRIADLAGKGFLTLHDTN